MAAANTAEYEVLRAELLGLTEEFEQAAAQHPFLGHQWLWGDEEMKAADWQAFFSANSVHGGDWQEWQPLPGRVRSARFFGFQQGLYDYLRLARRGWRLLRKIKRLAGEGQPLPVGVCVNLPDLGAQHGWTEAVYLTARAYATAVLSERSGYWGRTGQSTGDEDTLWTKTESGQRFLTCPAYEALLHDVFHSSAEAIRLWLSPSESLTVGEVAENTPPIVLPSTDTILQPSPDAAAKPNTTEWARPAWTSIGQLGELRVGGFLVKRYKQPAENQICVIQTFEEDKWLRCIDDPLTGKDDMDPKRRLRDTVEALNDYHKTPGLIRFEADGTGEGILWRYGPRAALLLGHPASPQ